MIRCDMGEHALAAMNETLTPCQLNYLHRMTARVAFVLLWIHGGTKVRSCLRCVEKALTTIVYSLYCESS